MTMGEAQLDVLLNGTVFYDLIFSGLPRLPQPGEEIWAKDLGASPGGIANLAVACARLGLKTGLVAAFGTDYYGKTLREELETHEGVDVSASPVIDEWPQPLTVSMSVGNDRAMVTRGEEPPVNMGEWVMRAPRAKTALVDLARADTWWAERAAAGTRLWADIGFDTTETWNPADLDPLEHCHAFTPNAVEAMAYTRTHTPEDAAKALSERVPLVIVTNGAEGSHAIDRTTGEEAFCPAEKVEAVDPTGAGDVFAAASVFASLQDGWSLMERLRFASRCAAFSVQRVGGAAGAPRLTDVMLQC